MISEGKQKRIEAIMDRISALSDTEKVLLISIHGLVLLPKKRGLDEERLAAMAASAFASLEVVYEQKGGFHHVVVSGKYDGLTVRNLIIWKVGPENILIVEQVFNEENGYSSDFDEIAKAAEELKKLLE